MNKDTYDMVRRLNFENIIWVVFIVISVLDIYGDELIKKELINNDKTSGDKAKKLFLGISIVSIIIYLYFLARNYSDYKKYKNKNYEIRLIASILVFVGAIMLLYFQINVKEEVDSLSNV